MKKFKLLIKFISIALPVPFSGTDMLMAGHVLKFPDWYTFLKVADHADPDLRGAFDFRIDFF